MPKSQLGVRPSVRTTRKRFPIDSIYTADGRFTTTAPKTRRKKKS